MRVSKSNFSVLSLVSGRRSLGYIYLHLSIDMASEDPDCDKIDIAALRSSFKEASLRKFQTKIEDMINKSGISKENISCCLQLGFNRGQIAIVAHEFYQKRGPTAANDHIANVVVDLFQKFKPFPNSMILLYMDDEFDIISM